MAQFDPIVVKSGIPTNLGADTLRSDLVAVAGLTTTGLTEHGYELSAPVE